MWRREIVSKWTIKLGLTLGLCVPAAGALHAAFQASSPKSVWDGAFTADQAVRGEAAYRVGCASCHGADLRGYVPEAASGGGNAPALVGEGFIDRFREDNLVELFRILRGGMPWGKPETMTDAEKIDVLAYMLRANAFPAGTSELRAEALGAIHLTGKEGPKPLPNETPVRTIGCLEKGPGNVWTLTSSPEPSRTQRLDETTPEELRFSAERPLGNLTFKLPGLDYGIPGFKPTPLAGHKVQVKGVVYRQPNNERINAKSVVSLSASCSR